MVYTHSHNGAFDKLKPVYTAMIPPDQIVMSMMNNKDVVQTAVMQGDVRLCCSHTKKAAL